MVEKSMDEKPKFPMTWDKCPVCGSTKRVAGMIGEEEKAKGKIRKTGFAVAFIQQVVISDPTIISLSAPALITYYDICAGYPGKPCGAVYCVLAQIGTAQPQSKMKTEGLPPFSSG